MNKKFILMISTITIIIIAFIGNSIYKNSDAYQKKVLNQEKYCITSKNETSCETKKKECKWDNTKKSLIGDGLCVPR